MFACFRQDVVDAHATARIFRRMIMDMDMTDVRNGFIDQELHIRGDPIALPDGQRALYAYRQIDDEMRSEAMRLNLLHLQDALDIFEQAGNLLRKLPARHCIHQLDG
jgi:hypothetical protein